MAGKRRFEFEEPARLDLRTGPLRKLVGQRITLFCMNYIYTGALVRVDRTTAQLSSAAVVYETGPFDDKKWKDAQPLPNDLFVMLSSVESFTVLK